MYGQKIYTVVCVKYPTSATHVRDCVHVSSFNFFDNAQLALSKNAENAANELVANNDKTATIVVEDEATCTVKIGERVLWKGFIKEDKV